MTGAIGRSERSLRPSPESSWAVLMKSSPSRRAPKARSAAVVFAPLLARGQIYVDLWFRANDAITEAALRAVAGRMYLSFPVRVPAR